jgi:hypothetical protein
MVKKTALKQCDFCYQLINTKQESHNASPRTGRYYHTHCFITVYGSRIRKGVKELLLDEESRASDDDEEWLH